MVAVKERIALLIKGSGGNQSEFARRLGVKPNHLSMVLSSDTGLSASILFKFAELGVNMNWLMMGLGEAWQKDQQTSSESEEKIAELESRLLRSKVIAETLESIILKKG